MTDNGNTYRLQVYCAACDVGHFMAFASINTAMYAAYRVKCNAEGHTPTLSIKDDYGFEEDDYTWQHIAEYLQSL
jgi:hypothetical protein